MIEIRITGDALEVRAEMQALLGVHTGVAALPEASEVADLEGQAPSPIKASADAPDKVTEAVKADVEETPAPAKKRSHKKKVEEPAPEKLEEPVPLQSEALTEEQKVELRTKSAEFCHAHADGKDKIKAFLGAKGLTKVTDMGNSMLPEYMALLEG